MPREGGSREPEREAELCFVARFLMAVTVRDAMIDDMIVVGGSHRGCLRSRV